MIRSYFFCGIGGSGMLPLAILLKERGHNVLGSDRSYDQGKSLEKFASLKNSGIELYAQDGSGVTKKVDYVVVSSAVENNIPDIKAAIEKNIPIIKRGALLAEFFNQASERIAVAGTSGKSTVTGMISTMLTSLNFDPTMVNGGEVLNLNKKFPSIKSGNKNLFVAEMDESDGSIEDYVPSIALLNNIALDHKPMEELEMLFGNYLSRSTRAVILNADQPRVMGLIGKVNTSTRIITYGLSSGDLIASNIVPLVDGVSFSLKVGNANHAVKLNVAGVHNVQNAMACFCVAEAMSLDIAGAIKALENFKGIHRRLELIGTINGVTVIDDFAHNPDKISATLNTLKAFSGRLLVIFQPHGFGPLKLMREELVFAFKSLLGNDDILMMPEAYYAGGSVDRSVTAKHLIDDLKASNINAYWFEKRGEIPEYIKSVARSGDRIIVMGARDDTLHIFANDLLNMF